MENYRGGEVKEAIVSPEKLSRIEAAMRVEQGSHFD